jgi:hypothetical protein
MSLEAWMARSALFALASRESVLRPTLRDQKQLRALKLATALSPRLEANVKASR